MLALVVGQRLRDVDFDARVEIAALVGLADAPAARARASETAGRSACPPELFRRSVLPPSVTTSTSPPSTAVGTGTLHARVAGRGP